MVQNKMNNLVSIAIFLLYNKMLLGHKKVKIVLGMKFQDKTHLNETIQKVIVGRHCCYKGKRIYSGTIQCQFNNKSTALKDLMIKS